MVPSPLKEAYPWAGRDSLRAWPLFLVKALFLGLQTLSFFLCWTFLFGPFVARNYEGLEKGLQDPDTFDWSVPLADLDRMVSDPAWIGIFLVTALLYVTWWSLLSALEDGGVYGTLLGLEREGKPFSVRGFLRGAVRTFFPMIGLQVYMGLGLLVPAALGTLVLLFVLAVLALLGPSPFLGLVLGFFLGVPCVVLGALFGLAFWAFGFLAQASIARGEPVGTAMGAAFARFRSQAWRPGIALMAPLAVYIVGNILLRFMSLVLTLVPVLGFTAALLDLALGVGSYLFIMVFLPALSLRMTSEEKK